ncbi:MAG: hypothetical protein KBI01_03590 [Oscillospiraceae bacterium]|nr:hypothetical protein [Oscillospiraceae bacterium]
MARAKHSKKKNKNDHRILAVIVTILVVVLAVLVFLYRDELPIPSLSKGSEDIADIISESEPFTYETGSQLMFALMGDKLAVASSTGLQMLDSGGKTVSREVFSMVNPAVCTNSSSCAVYDVGGYSLRIYKDGEFKNLDRDGEIISVSVNSGGYYAVAGYEAGYKGSVTVYNETLSSIYEWFSGSGYILDAAVSPDNSSLAVLCVESSGTIVHLFHFDSEDEYSSVSIPNELAFKLSFDKSGTFCVLSEKAIHFYGSKAQELSVYSFEDNYLANYSLSEEYRAVVLSKYVSGTDVTLQSFGGTGKVLGSAPLSSEPLSIFSQGQKLLVLGSSDISLYSHDLKLQKQNHVVPGYVSAVLLPKGGVLLLSSHYGEKCELR